jgi:hypothetical protein
VVHTQVCLWPVDKDVQTISFRGSKSRNKVSVCEPADGSLSVKRERLDLLLFVVQYVSTHTIE